MSDEKTNMCEPLLTHRNVEYWHRNRGGTSSPGRADWGRVTSGPGQGAACVPSWWCPVYRWRELVAGAGMEQENLSPRNRRPVEMGDVGPLAAKGRTPSGDNRKG